MTTGKRAVVRSFTLGLALLVSAAVAHAADQTPNNGARSGYDGTVASLIRGELSAPLTRAVANMVAESVSILRQAGQNQLATKYETEWKQWYSQGLRPGDFIRGASKDDIGDHPPASEWLANLYNTLDQYSAGIIRSVRLINDINTLNYALPVVFTPTARGRRASSMPTASSTASTSSPSPTS